MDEISNKVLGAVHAFLERLTHADNLTSDQLTEAHMATTALGYQIARMNYDPERLASVQAAEAALASRLQSGKPASPVARQWAGQWQQGVGAHLAAVIAAQSDAPSDKAISDVRDFLVSYHSAMDPVVSAGTRSTYTGGRGDQRANAEEEKIIEITAPALEKWLHESGAEPNSTRVVDVKRLMGGYSKATYIVKLARPGGDDVIVIRKDGYGLPTGSSVTAEYPVLVDMAAIGLPVPAPLWVEPDETTFSTAFMGVAFQPGTPANHIVPTDPETRRKWAASCAEAIGKLHRETALPGADIRVILSAEIDDLERRVIERERAPHPGLVLGLQWLRAHLDDLAGRPACRVHGDLGFHNFLMADDRIVAILDWEFSHIGDPVEDLTSIKPFMDQLESWDAFYETYRAICGYTLDARAEQYFSVWRDVRNLIACLGSLNSLLLPPVKDVPLCVAGTIYIPKYEIAVLDGIAEANAFAKREAEAA